MPIKITNIVGARPNFMKIAPLVAEMKRHPQIEQTLVHTGQHYDEKMSQLFFEHLGIPKPDIDLGVGSDTHGAQTGTIMIRFEQVLLEQQPDVVVVVGDVNSTIACGLVAVKQGVKLAHVEAGLRSFDRTMPEEINRILTDQISDFLFVTEKSGEENLVKEGVARDKIHFVGNVMIDTLQKHRSRAMDSPVLSQYNLQSGAYAALTLHRPSNVDDKATLSGIIDALDAVQKELPIVFPLHPRTRERLREFGLQTRVEKLPQLILTEPLGYLDFLKILSEARFVLTDSGGIQEETTVLGVPCLTLRENTERPVTVTQGTNRIIGSQTEAIIQASKRILNGESKEGRLPDLWDGKAAERIVEVLLRGKE